MTTANQKWDLAVKKSEMLTIEQLKERIEFFAEDFGSAGNVVAMMMDEALKNKMGTEAHHEYAVDRLIGGINV